jgi:hypothetical protein
LCLRGSKIVDADLCFNMSADDLKKNKVLVEAFQKHYPHKVLEMQAAPPAFITFSKLSFDLTWYDLIYINWNSYDLITFSQIHGCRLHVFCHSWFLAYGVSRWDRISMLPRWRPSELLIIDWVLACYWFDVDCWLSVIDHWLITEWILIIDYWLLIAGWLLIEYWLIDTLLIDIGWWGIIDWLLIDNWLMILRLLVIDWVLTIYLLLFGPLWVEGMAWGALEGPRRALGPHWGARGGTRGPIGAPKLSWDLRALPKPCLQPTEGQIITNK